MEHGDEANPSRFGRLLEAIEGSGRAQAIARMSFLSQGEVPHLISAYGYWAVGCIIALESMGIPLPGESTLIAAAMIAGTTHGLNNGLNIWMVVVSAAVGAILGDNVGFWIGREFGFRLVVRYGSYVGLTESRIKLGQYLFLRHGAEVVFFGRFVAVLRALAAFLAGVNSMDWKRFLLSNAAGGLAWAAIYGFAAWYFGKQISQVAEPARIAVGIMAVAVIVGSLLFFRHHEAQLQAKAEAVLPGPVRHVVRRKRTSGGQSQWT